MGKTFDELTEADSVDKEIKEIGMAFDAIESELKWCVGYARYMKDLKFHSVDTCKQTAKKQLSSIRSTLQSIEKICKKVDKIL